MKRREAIKTIAGLGVLITLPGVLSSIGSLKKSTPNFIGLGGGGTNVLECFKEQNVKGNFTGIRTFFSNDNTTKSGINYIDMFSYIAESGYSNIEKGHYIPNELEQILHRGNNFVLIAGLGGRLGANLLMQSVKILNRQGKEYTVVGMLPFNFEGAKRRDKAQQLHSELKEYTEPVMLNLEKEIRAKYGDMRIAVAFEKANEEMYLKWIDSNLRDA